MNLQNLSRVNLFFIVLSLFCTGLIVFTLAIATSSVQAAPKRPRTWTPTPIVVPTATPTPQPTPGSGPHWQDVSIPDIGTVSRLADVAIISANDIRAVGATADPNVPFGWKTLILHWNGVQ